MIKSNDIWLNNERTLRVPYSIVLNSAYSVSCEQGEYKCLLIIMFHKCLCVLRFIGFQSLIHS